MIRKRMGLAGILVLLAAGVVMTYQASGQNPTSPMGEPPRRDTPNEAPVNPEAEKHALEENEKDVKKKVERLYELATELKAEADKTDSSKVLNLTMLKKVEEIEKLARDIKTRSKG